MSNFNESLGTFKPYNYKSNETGNKLKQRMAGDYMSDFVNANVNDKKYEQKDFTYQDSDGKDYGTNTEKMLFGNTSNDGGKSLEKATAAKPASQPAASTGVIGGIDYDAMVDAKIATPGATAGGADKEWWLNKYKKNNSEYEQNKALMASHTGPKTWDELVANEKSRGTSGDAKSRNSQSIADYNSYTKYATAQQAVDHWEKSTAKYRN